MNDFFDLNAFNYSFQDFEDLQCIIYRQTQ